MVTLYSKESILLSWQSSKRKQGTIISSRPISSRQPHYEIKIREAANRDRLASAGRYRDIAPGEYALERQFKGKGEGKGMECRLSLIFVYPFALLFRALA